MMCVNCATVRLCLIVSSGGTAGSTPPCAAHPVALDARELGERVRARRDPGRDRRIGRRSRGAGDLRRDGLRLLAVVARPVRNRADGDQKRKHRHDDSGQYPGLPARALLIHHSRILDNAADAGNPY